MSSITLKPVEDLVADAGEITALLLPELLNHYQKRASRLRELAEGHEQGSYLLFAAQVAAAQQTLLEQMPVPALEVSALAVRLDRAIPLQATSLQRSAYWQAVLKQLLEHLAVEATLPTRQVLDSLAEMSPEQLDACADHLLHGRHERLQGGQAVFIWAALMLYFTQLAAALPATAHASTGEQRHCCPVCGSAPVASEILTGKLSGLRYLHCSLCESRWHMVRAKCSNCEETGKLDYWSLDDQKSPVKAESCGDCSSYLKVFYYEHDRALEPVADDLASLDLDAAVEQEGFARSSFNPFLFAG